MEKINWIDKGLYHHPQPLGFVSLKQYMIVQNGEKRCLMLRFLNELSVAVSAIEFKLTQLDLHGVPLGSANIRVDSMGMAPGATHAMKSGIVISEKCVDFKVTVLSATSNGYKYVLRHGIPTPTYDLKKKPPKHIPRESSRSATARVTTKGRIAVTLLSLGILTVTAILMIIFSMRVFGDFTAENLQNLIF